MSKAAVELVCKTTMGGTWVMCPVCRRGKLLKLTTATRARGLVLFCRQCKHETTVNITPGGGRLPRVHADAVSCLPGATRSLPVSGHIRA